MSALNVVRQVADIAEASGVPCVENVAKVAVVVFKLFEKKGKNKKNVKELCESIANTIAVIDAFVRMHGEPGASHFKDICGEMEVYLESIAQDLKDMKRKHRGFKGVFSVDDFREAIQAYRRRVDDLKTDFLIHSVGDCVLKVTEMHSLWKDGMAEAVVGPSEEFVFRIPKKPLAITAFFFLASDSNFFSQ
ncbi:uncharacterized protein EV420DRAFT_1646404 [Desarmillaria tabescens]|uniref:Uncharacterized protein n=1 Tax=Armillaria tabescens TaxID=1929756 RepID=A0AA39MXE1_ARMTA|nr:uncharacterized protein EV420DRAFT_1646404 [Desarmillaria tabescens]KAK0450481.1 hypothetical protein EV420DRAFT_1646404 [Desarmillaria tabescens]